jgi:hypothetical protein
MIKCKKDMMELPVYNKKILETQKTLFELNKDKYNLILKIFQEISKIVNKQILILSDFKKISEAEIKQNSEKISNILLENKTSILELLNVDFKYDKKNIHARNITIFRKLVKTINYQINIRQKQIYLINNN